jgi:hypothetical protein
MKIEVLILDGCPNVQVTVDRLKAVLREYGLSLTINEINVGDEKAADELRFLGSPTVRIDGMDIEPPARQRTTFGIMCRTYEGSGGVPSEDLIRRAIKERVASTII